VSLALQERVASVMASDVARLADSFLSRITEDDTGIWELADLARSRLAGMPTEERHALACAALGLLLDRGLIRARRGLAFDPRGEELDAPTARSVIEHTNAWLPPKLTDGLTVMLHTTEAGDQLYFSGQKLEDGLTSA